MKTRLYRVWCSMKERCNNPHHKSFAHYGGKGIQVCTEWSESYSAFKEWSESHGYHQGLTIDRIDGNGGYAPNNCRWVTFAVQNRNYSRNHNITYQGRTQCLADWADEFGINRTTISLRIKSGKPLDEVFSRKDGRRTRHDRNREG